MNRLVIVGATGMVGGYALRYAFEHPDVEQVTSIGRRKLSVSNSKLTEVLHRDFTDCSALAEALSRQDAAVFCLGAYTGAVSDADFVRSPWRQTDDSSALGTAQPGPSQLDGAVRAGARGGEVPKRRCAGAASRRKY
jgi:Semialdehyde dehydrogenase, NAD binding domain